MKPRPTPFDLTELFDSLDEVLAWVKDLEGRYQWVNRAFLLNYDLENPEANVLADSRPILGKTDYDLSPAFLADQFRLDDEQVLAGHRIVNRIELVGHSPEEAEWNVTNKIPLYGPKGTITGTAGTTRRLGKVNREVASAAAFGPALACMRDHYHEVISNQRLADVSHMSVRTFERKFFASFHLTPQQYLRRLRLRMASRALVYGAQPLSEVALSCGFSDQSHFTREFHRHFHRTPRDYREHYASQPADAALDPKSAVPKQ